MLLPGRSLLAIPLALLGAACSCPSSVTTIDDFEGCTGTCGWTIDGPGKASVVSTILPGEHGLQLEGDVGATKSLATPVVIDGSFDLKLVAACPAGFAVSLTVGVPGGGDQTIDVMPAVDETPTSSGDLPDYTGVSYFPLDGPITLPAGVTSASVHGVTVHANAGPPCVLDLVQLSAARTCSGSS